MDCQQISDILDCLTVSKKGKITNKNKVIDMLHSLHLQELNKPDNWIKKYKVGDKVVIHESYITNITKIVNNLIYFYDYDDKKEWYIESEEEIQHY